MNITATDLRQMVTDHPTVRRSVTSYELNNLDQAEVDAWATALGIAVMCTAYYCQARAVDGGYAYHATKAEVDACAEASEVAEEIEYQQERATERAWQEYDECGAYMGH